MVRAHLDRRMRRLIRYAHLAFIVFLVIFSAEAVL